MVPGIQNGARGGRPLWMWFQTCSCVLRTWIFWTVAESRDTTSSFQIISHGSCHCNLVTSRSPLVTVQLFSAPTNLCLTPLCLASSITILDKQLTEFCNFLPCIKLHLFCDLANTVQSDFLNLCLLGYSPHCGSAKTLYTLIIDCLLIISIDTYYKPVFLPFIFFSYPSFVSLYCWFLLVFLFSIKMACFHSGGSWCFYPCWKDLSLGLDIGYVPYALLKEHFTLK